ncbi:zf-TFIIB domain-containing protein [Mumia sp. zg.B53]|uniref:TFIIB-type zinc ribbon-containing protein n=1 Tax=unclassified Mumia TaxID=2621872 RepID=UPI001C6EB93B|nr:MULTISPECIES: zf-TFIIB domain-containing protein [unclassified Mumia]MBW9211200.1 zf-TFIIB domain-containing protein [Mumia sp. zg.B21]MBW9215775.1 zf-TFIIB domain-containing protein [Mumia sp. zg.B53]MDD9349942.1 zf-TFIIB domain-containing protein [Mumia sp.]
MRCPNDETTLVMSERSGIEIDYCPECRGVWLDRGELDKIIDRAGSQSAPAAPSPPSPGSYQQAPPQQQYQQRGYDDRRYDDRSPRRKKKENWLSDLFD